jgi:hypothetical protein
MSQSRSRRPAAPEAGRTEGVRRRPHEGAGPCVPYGGRRPGRCGGRTGGPARLVAAALTVAAVIGCAALLAACGGSSRGAPATVSASAAPTPVPSPLVTNGSPPAAAVDVVKQFWTLTGEGRLAEAQRVLVAPGSPILQWTGDDIVAARYVRLVPHSVGGFPAEGATIEFSAVVWIDAGPAASAWGPAGDHQLFEHVVRMSDGTWRMWDSGTGP